jgi:hypothetical protein
VKNSYEKELLGSVAMIVTFSLWGIDLGR